MGYITEIKIHCSEKDSVVGTDDLEFLNGGTSIGHVSIGTGEDRDVGGSTPLFDHGFVNAGDTLSAQVDHLYGDKVIWTHTVTDDEIQNGLHGDSNSGCGCKYTFDFTFEPSI